MDCATDPARVDAKSVAVRRQSSQQLPALKEGRYLLRLSAIRAMGTGTDP